MGNMARIKDLSGQKIGSWTVIKVSERKASDGIYFWHCKCDCGQEREVRGQNLRNGQSVMCSSSCAILVLENRKRIFAKKIIKAVNGCWIWTGLRDVSGYGMITIEMRANRFSYENFIGKIPDGMCVENTCGVPSCVNPKCLWLGLHSESKNEPRKKISEKDVIKIRKMYIEEKRTKASLAREFRVSNETISQLIRRETWRHVP